MTFQTVTTLPCELHDLKQYISCRGKHPALLNQNGTENRNWNRPHAWATLEGVRVLAEAANSRSENAYSIGLVLTTEIPYPKKGKALGVVDLDHCANDPAALQIIQKFNSFTEYSQSKNGYHIFFEIEGTADQYCGKRCFNTPVKGDVRFHDNYIVVTGLQVDGTPNSLNTLTKTQVEIILGVDIDKDYTPKTLDADAFKKMQATPIENDNDRRWRQILDMAQFDPDLKHLLHGRIKVSNKLKEDNTGSGVAFRILLRVWDMFTDPSDLMAIYAYAYTKYSGGSTPTPSSVRASVYKILNTRGAGLQFGTKVNVYIEDAEQELYQSPVAPQADSEHIAPQDFLQWRKLFYSLTGTKTRIHDFYLDQITQEYILLLKIPNFPDNLTVVKARDSIFTGAGFRSKLAHYFGLSTVTSAKLQKVMPIFAQCYRLANERIKLHLAAHAEAVQNNLAKLISQLMTSASVTPGRVNTSIRRLILDTQDKLHPITPESVSHDCVYFTPNGERVVTAQFVDSFLERNHISHFSIKDVGELYSALGLEKMYEKQGVTLYRV